MTLTYRDRVVDASSTTGTGAFTLGGLPPPGFRDFTAFPTGATVRYTIVHENNLQWEVGEGVWTTSGAQLTRVKVFASSNAGALVNFSAGGKTVSAGPVAADMRRPAFKAYRGTTQTLTANTFTKVQLNVVDFDTSGAFDATTNFRFTPQVAGYYQVNGQVSSLNSARLLPLIYKNGTVVARGTDIGAGLRSSVSDVVYLNGSTDFIELWCLSSLTSITGSGGTQDLYLSGVLVAPAP